MIRECDPWTAGEAGPGELRLHVPLVPNPTISRAERERRLDALLAQFIVSLNWLVGAPGIHSHPVHHGGEPTWLRLSGIAILAIWSSVTYEYSVLPTSISVTSNGTSNTEQQRRRYESRQAYLLEQMPSTQP